MDTIHIMPIDDIFEHEETENCVCDPGIEDRNGYRIVIHNAFDGREKWENEYLCENQ